MGGVYNPFNLNLYAYSHQNPVKLLDPDGEVVVFALAAAAYTAVAVAIIRVTPAVVRVAWRGGAYALRWASNAYKYGTPYASAYSAVRLGQHSHTLLDKGGKAIGTVFTSRAGQRLVTPVLQLGKRSMDKLRKHAVDFGIGSKGNTPSGWQDSMKEIAKSIYSNATEIRKGIWKGGSKQSGGVDNVTFYRKGGDIVLTRSDGSLLTMLKDGTGKKSWREAKTIWKK